MAESRLVFTKSNHVLCPNCGDETYPPYYDAHIDWYFKGHYCETCGLVWHWNQQQRKLESSM